MNHIKNYILIGLALCILWTSAAINVNAAPVDGMTAFRDAYLTNPVQSYQFETTTSFFGPTFHADVKMCGEWSNKGAVWTGGEINWNDTNLNTGHTDRKEIPVYIEYSGDTLFFYGKDKNIWQHEQVMDIPMWILRVMKSRDMSVLEENASAVQSVRLLKDDGVQQQMQLILNGPRLAELTRSHGMSGSDKNMQFTEYLAQALEQTDLECTWVIDRNTKQTITFTANLTELMRNYAKSILQASYESKLTLTKEEQDYYQAMGYYCNLSFYCNRATSQDTVKAAYDMGRTAKNSAVKGSILDMLRRDSVNATIH